MISPAVASHSGTVMRRDIAEEGRDVRAAHTVIVGRQTACCSPLVPDPAKASTPHFEVLAPLASSGVLHCLRGANCPTDFCKQ